MLLGKAVVRIGIGLLELGLFVSACIHAQEKVINVWEGTDCKAKVRLTAYLAEGNDNIACIVCPGGSYFWLDRPTEGVGVAEWLRSEGISAFVLEYRVGGFPAFFFPSQRSQQGHRYPDMLQDVQRSIQLIRENAAEYGIDAQKLGIMGFSAGGHLAALSGIYFDADVSRFVGETSSVSLKPDFIASIYPVVSMVDRATHKRSQRGALGEGQFNSEKMRDSLSIERHVRADMPPTYLMNCVDDPIVAYRNSALFDSAMMVHKVPHRYVQYKTGGHGFGATPRKTSEEAIAWKEDFIHWLRDIIR